MYYNNFSIALLIIAYNMDKEQLLVAYKEYIWRNVDISWTSGAVGNSFQIADKKALHEDISVTLELTRQIIDHQAFIIRHEIIFYISFHWLLYLVHDSYIWGVPSFGTFCLWERLWYLWKICFGTVFQNL